MEEVFKELRGNRIAVALDKAEIVETEKTQGGLILGTEVEVLKEPTTATVKYVGQLQNRGEYEVGDRIFIGEFHATPIDVLGEKLIIMKPDDVLFKI